MWNDLFGHIKSTNDISIIGKNIALALGKDDLNSNLSYVNALIESGEYYFDCGLISEFGFQDDTQNLYTTELIRKDLNKFCHPENFDFVKPKPLSFEEFKELELTSNALIIGKNNLINFLPFLKSRLPWGVFASDLDLQEFPKEIIFVYDYHETSIDAIKEFINNFELRNAKVIAIFLNDHLKRNPITREKIVVNFLLQSFPDVGILVSDTENLQRDVKRVCCEFDNSVLIMGKPASNIILNKNILLDFLNLNLSYFFKR